MNEQGALAALPDALRDTLFEEYQNIVQNYHEHRWLPTELSGGRFCEIVFTILDGYAKGTYPSSPKKPRGFVGCCRTLEKNKHVPRSFQILIPRLLPALYDVRNSRGVGHVGGDVNPNNMDATFVIINCNWVMSELIRVFHDLSTREAQDLVDNLAELRLPLIWKGNDIRRVLDPHMSLSSQILLLLASANNSTTTTKLLEWSDSNNRSYFRKLLRKLHKQRLLELSKDGKSVQILPPGNLVVAEIVRSRTRTMTG